MSLIKTLKQCIWNLLGDNLAIWGRKKVDRLFYTPTKSMQSIGDRCSWTIDTSLLTKDSIVYCVGVGADISFELELAEKFGCTIFLFDPTPIAKKTMGLKKNQHDNIFFSTIGLAGKSGRYNFNTPTDASKGSWVATKASLEKKNSGEHIYECLSVLDIMKKYDHTNISLLKMDIEGFEYDVIDHIMHHKLQIQQICVEFHDFFENIPYKKTAQALRILMKEGYKVVHKYMKDYTFLRSTK